VLQHSGSFAGPVVLVACILVLAAALAMLVRLPVFATRHRSEGNALRIS
jgi:hypothetical protein